MRRDLDLEAARGLLLASLAGLLFELLFIRWVPSTIHVVGFFTNLVLVACFLGLGLGVARPRDSARATGRAFLRLSLATVLLCAALFLRLKVEVTGEHALNESAELLEPLLRASLYLVLPAIFGMMAWVFVPLGEMVGCYFRRLPPIQAYSINILGSLLGVIIFGGLSYFKQPPWIWLLAGFAVLLPLSGRRLVHGLVALVLVTMVFGTYSAEERSSSWKNLWTPYYNLKVYRLPAFPDGSPAGFGALVSNFFLLSGTDPMHEPGSDTHELYSLPYEYVAPRSVLVLGSGGGNDVAVALAHGASSVDAVEIDPVILELGTYLNPSRPYQDPRVTIHNQDARNYLRRSKRQYDLIAFGTLDSHGLFSALSSVKMENFVYTKESFEAARRRLDPDRGVASITVGFDQDWIHLKLYGLVQEVFGGEPIAHVGLGGMATIVAGPGIEGVEPVELPHMPPLDASELERRVYGTAPGELPTDDWPHLFLRSRSFPAAYLWVGLALLAASVLAVRRGFGAGGVQVYSHFFFLGAGFMLLETKNITHLALVFGATWLTSAVVISAILAVILLANLLVLRARRPRQGPWYFALAGGLLVTYLLPPEWLLVPDFAAQVLISGLFAGLPIFFAAKVFAVSFREAPDMNAAFASNLLGATCGGMLEYLSLVIGFRQMMLVAAALYLLSLVGVPWARQQTDLDPFTR